MPDKPPYFPLYVNDLTADGKVEVMTTEEFGAYIFLLCKAWKEEPCGSIPDDDATLARWAKLSRARWRKARPKVLACFVKMADGRWHQKRMSAEYQKFLRVSRQRAKAASTRWTKAGSESGGVADSDAIALQMQCGALDANGVQPSDSDSKYASGSASHQGKGVGGVGEGVPPAGEKTSPDLNPLALANAWCFYLTRKFRGYPADKLEDAAACIAEIVRLGADPATLLREIESPGRNRNETLRDFEFRMGKRGGRGKEPGGGVGQPTRIRTDAAKVDAVTAKTIRVGVAPAEQGGAPEKPPAATGAVHRPD
jgi:uncharacterized protein YdaU (DUF1376 family)